MKANYKSIRKKLNIAMGQLEGVSKMVDTNRYCIDISIQLLAVASALKNINNEILDAHLKSCIKDAFLSGTDEEIDEKLSELLKMFNKLNR